jgi:hypothetical protein
LIPTKAGFSFLNNKKISIKTDFTDDIDKTGAEDRRSENLLVIYLLA